MDAAAGVGRGSTPQDDEGDDDGGTTEDDDGDVEPHHRGDERQRRRRSSGGGGDRRYNNASRSNRHSAHNHPPSSSRRRRRQRSPDGADERSATEDESGSDSGGDKEAGRGRKHRFDSNSRRSRRESRPSSMFPGSAFPTEGNMGVFPDMYDPYLGMQPYGGPGATGAGFPGVSSYWPSPMGMLGAGGGAFGSPGLPFLGGDMNTMLAQHQLMQFMHMQQMQSQHQQAGGSLMGIGGVPGGDGDAGDLARSRLGSSLHSHPALGLPLPMMPGWPSPGPTYPHLGGMMGLPGMLQAMSGGGPYPYPQHGATTGLRSHHDSLLMGPSVTPSPVPGIIPSGSKPPRPSNSDDNEACPDQNKLEVKVESAQDLRGKSLENSLLPVDREVIPPPSDKGLLPRPAGNGQQQPMIPTSLPAAAGLVLMAEAGNSSGSVRHQEGGIRHEKEGQQQKDKQPLASRQQSEERGFETGDALVSVHTVMTTALSRGGKEDRRSSATANSLDALAAAAEAIGGA